MSKKHFFFFFCQNKYKVKKNLQMSDIHLQYPWKKKKSKKNKMKNI